MDFFVEAAIGCYVSLLGFWYISNRVFNYKSKLVIVNTILITLASLSITYLNVISNSSSNKLIKVLLIYIFMVLFNKINYKRKLTNTIVGTFLGYTIFFISDALLSLFFLLISKIINHMLVLEYSLTANILSSILAIILSKCLKKIYGKIYNNLTSYNIDIIISIIILVLIIAIFGTMDNIQSAILSIDFLLTIFLIILSSIIGIFLIKQKADIDNGKKDYSKLANYSKITETVLEDYRINVHENKNQLIIIDGMIPKKYKEVHEYISTLIESKSNNKYSWISELKHIPLPELKSFLNYKIMEIKNDKINLEIIISRDIKKQFFNNFKIKDKEDLYSIIGVVIDNAHEAAKESRKKEISIQIYMKDKKIIFTIANTFKGKVNLKMINDYGYTSKGKNHGTGLHIVNNIINRNKKYECKTSIIEKYFVQEISISK